MQLSAAAKYLRMMASLDRSMMDSLQKAMCNSG